MKNVFLLMLTVLALVFAVPTESQAVEVDVGFDVTLSIENLNSVEAINIMTPVYMLDNIGTVTFGGVAHVYEGAHSIKAIECSFETVESIRFGAKGQMELFSTPVSDLTALTETATGMRGHPFEIEYTYEF